MSLLTTTTLAALLVASPSSSDADRLAANGGFLLGNAQRCGIASERQLVRRLILAASRDPREEEDSRGRLAAFFLVSSFADAGADAGKKKLAASCRIVTSEFEQLERHALGAGGSASATEGSSLLPRFGPGDGE
jgi:hypothetical protein